MLLETFPRLWLNRADNQAVNSRRLVRRQKKHGSQKWCGELAELTVTLRDELCSQYTICYIIFYFYGTGTTVLYLYFFR